MKKFIIFAILFSFLFPFTVSSKMNITFYKEGHLFYDSKLNKYYLEDDADSKIYINSNELKNTTKDFQNCVDNLKYKGKLSIKSETKSGQPFEYLLNKDSVCERSDGYGIITQEGKIKYDKKLKCYILVDNNGSEVLLDLLYDKEFTNMTDMNKYEKISKEFKQCLDNFKYKGKVSITSPTVTFHEPGRPYHFILGKISTCKRIK